MRFSRIYVLSLLILTVAGSTPADSRVKIDTVPAEYAPDLSILREPVFLKGFHFEINKETCRARIVVTFSYAENTIAGWDDGGGPRPTVAQVSGLFYDVDHQAVIYESSGQRTVCAVVQKSDGFWGHHSEVKNTGACTVSTEPAEMTVDDGWDLHHLHVLIVYLDVH